MFNNVALDVVIGLVFIFLLYSLLASIIQEIIATKLSFRAKILQKGILRMLEDGKTTASLPLWDSFKGFYQLIFRSNNLKNKRFATAFYTHPLLKYLAEDNWFSKPDYISAKNFSKTMIDLLNGIDNNLQGPDILRIKNSITTGKLNIKLKAEDEDNPANKNYREQQKAAPDSVDINPETQLFLQSLLSESKGDIEKFKLLLEGWFEDTMQRTTGWYKRYTQYILLIVGFVLAYTFNVDSIAIGKILAKDEKARDQIVEMAVKSVDKYKGIVDSIPGNDSLLQNTFQLVKEDADKAVKVLGLGRPWKDTCTMCKDSLDKMNRVISEYKDRRITGTDLLFHQSESKRLQELINADSAKNPLQTKADTSRKQIKDARINEKQNHDTLIANHNNLTPEEARLIFLSQRCAIIKEATRGKWNKYSPNQEGGWETFAGWLITALAISLGAPFWFDMLSKLVRVRGSGTIKDSSATTTPVTSTQAPAQTINVNTNSGEEAVG